MSRITECFAKLKSQGKTVLIPFITAGDPQPEVTVPLMQELVTSGADILELGIPFSDPMADGPVIQKANERALANGMTLRDCLDLVHNFRTVNTQTPIILMGYLNPIEVMGYNNFAQQALLAGVDGVITVDIPPEESAELLTALRSVAIDSIYLIAPTSTPERIQRICAVARGFVYYVSMRGVTGALHLDLQEVTNRLNIIRKLTTLPIGVGFGIKDSDTAARMASVADAVVVGSAIVRQIENLKDQPDKILEVIGAFLRDLRTALDTTQKANLF